MLLPSMPAPDFTLPDRHGTPHTLRALLASGPVVLAFYPADNTPLCTKQHCMVRDRFAQLANAGVRVVGISPQNADAKDNFVQSHNLRHLLLVDKSSKVAAMYGARGLFGLPLPFGTRRMSFLVRATPGAQPHATIELAAHQEFGLAVHERLLDDALRLAQQWGSATPGTSTPDASSPAGFATRGAP